MKKTIRNSMVWLAITLMSIAVILVFGKAKIMSSLIMSTLWLLPIRASLIASLNWAIVFLCSNFQNIRNRLQSITTINDLVDQNKRSLNPAFFRSINIVATIVTVLGGLFSWVFQTLSSNIVYLCIHNIQTVIQKLFGTGIEKFSILLWFILEIFVISIIIWFISLFPRGVFGGTSQSGGTPTQSSSHMRFQVLFFILTFIGSRLKNYIILSYTGGMIVTSVIFWVIAIGIPAIVIIGVIQLSRIL